MELIGRTGQIVEQSHSSEKLIECRRFDREGLCQLQCPTYAVAMSLYQIIELIGVVWVSLRLDTTLFYSALYQSVLLAPTPSQP